MGDGADQVLPSRETLSGLLDYNPDSGLLAWQKTIGSRRKGSVAGRLHHKGYIEVGVGKRRYLAHRLIWAMQTGEWLPPSVQIDHINGDKADNSWANLRKATPSQNKMNCGAQSNSKSGIRGVHLCKQTGNWKVVISVNGKPRNLSLIHI